MQIDFVTISIHLDTLERNIPCKSPHSEKKNPWQDISQSQVPRIRNIGLDLKLNLVSILTAYKIL